MAVDPLPPEFMCWTQSRCERCGGRMYFNYYQEYRCSGCGEEDRGSAQVEDPERGQLSDSNRQPSEWKSAAQPD